MKRSKKNILLVDSTKFNKAARYTFAETEDFDRILCIGDVYSEFEQWDNVTNIESENKNT
jgi:DeoR/GlpR family transcriptional regulator of sugar metabolism